MTPIRVAEQLGDKPFQHPDTNSKCERGGRQIPYEIPLDGVSGSF